MHVSISRSGVFKMYAIHGITQSVHMKYIQFYCNTAHEPKGIGVKTKSIWVGYTYDQRFYALHLQTINWDSVSGPADNMSACHFSPHVAEQVKGNCSHCNVYPARKIKQSSCQWWHIQSILDVPTKEWIMGSKVRHTGWRSDRPTPANPFLCKLAI